MAEQEEDFSCLPLTDRFAHKNWKVRKEAYEAAAKEFDNAQSETDSVVKQFVQDPGLWKAAVTDANVAAHQEALVALCSFLQIAGYQGCVRTRGQTIGPITEKGLTSTKPVAKQKAADAILLYVELDKAEPVIEELLPLLSHKLPKIVAATLAAFTSIYHAYGCKTVDPKPVLKILPKVFGHADKNVRAEAQALTSEFYRWLREGMKPLFWNDLKPVQQQDLEKLFDKVKDEPTPKPERLLKSQQEAVAAAPEAAVDADEEVGDEDDEAADELEPGFMAVDVFPKIPKDLQERLASSKWKDRKEALDDLQTVVNVPAIEPGPFDEIMHSLAKCMKDANIAVVTVAANCVELLAKGLRKAFGKYRTIVMGSVMERLKERKQSVTDALGAALDAICAATSISECLEEILSTFQHKNPLVKLESTRFLVRALKLTKEAPNLPEVKLIIDATAKLLGDAQETQRSAASEVFGTLLKIFGEKIMNTHLEGLDDSRKGKIKEFAETAEVNSKYKPKVAAPPRPAPAPVATQKRPIGKKPTGPPAARKPLGAGDEFASAPLQPKPIARPALAKPVSSSSGARGLKPPTGLAGRRPAPAASSPRRAPQSPTYEDEPTPPPVSRGLTGRHLSKPSTTSITQFAAPSAISNPGLSAAERTELEDLRNQVESLRAANETLHAEHVQLNSQIHDLQDQNAQLIEDHTRDVLSIKAKETQLVRARSDAESAEQAASQLQREVDWLRRELGRINRAESPAEVFQESATSLNSGSGVSNAPSFKQRATDAGKENELRGYTHNGLGSTAKLTDSRVLSPRSAGIPRPTSHVSHGSQQSAASQRTVQAPSSYSQMRPLSGLDGGSVDGTKTPTEEGGFVGISRDAGTASNGTSSRAGGERNGQESWRRAAEVTQNLKARIELMKQRQGMPRT